jgi:hypothetical protein
MATGLEHYRQAEQLIAAVTLPGMHPDGSPVVRADEPETIALAQVHATLALAAATALAGAGSYRYSLDYRAWRRSVGEPDSLRDDADGM